MTPLENILLILAASALVLVIAHRVRVPSVVGLLVAGAVLGPHGLGMVSAAEQVRFLAELGVVLLLFTVGLEVPIQDLWRLRRVALGGGGLQIVLSVLAGFGLLLLAGQSPAQSLLAGFFLALSSTAIVLKMLQDRGETATPAGRAATGVLLFQDLAVVPMLLVLPVLSGTSEIGFSLSARLLTSAGLLTVVVASRWVVPWAMKQVVRTRDREVFALSVVVIGLAVAWLTHAAHLSLALGAFFAGVIMAESEYSHDAMGVVLPFRHVFASIFFFSVGMLLDIGLVIENLPLVLALSVGVVTIKAVASAGGLRLAGEHPRSAIHAGIALAQVGEFSFVVLQAGLVVGLVAGETYQLFLSVAVTTLGLTPLLVAVAPAVSRRAAAAMGFPVDSGPSTGPSTDLRDHLIIVGGGLGGRHVAQAARSCGIPYVILEMNPERVRELRKSGEPARYGDAVYEPALVAVQAPRARVLVLTIPDPAATRRIIALVRKLHPGIHLIVRTRYVAELQSLLALGANQVVIEEFEVSIEIFTRVLAAYMIPHEDIQAVASDIRAEGYQMLRGPGARSDFGAPGAFPGTEVRSYRVAEKGEASDRTLAELDLRRRYGVTVFAIRRGEETIANPGGDERVRAGDVVVLLGKSEQLTEVTAIFFRSGDAAIPPDDSGAPAAG